MHLLQTDTSHTESEDAWAENRASWLAEQTTGVFYRDNLVYLPFAAHLSDEDAEAESFAKAA